MEIPFRYKAFISYSHQDQKFGKWLHKEIENLTITLENMAFLYKNTSRLKKVEEAYQESLSLQKKNK